MENEEGIDRIHVLKCHCDSIFRKKHGRVHYVTPRLNLEEIDIDDR